MTEKTLNKLCSILDEIPWTPGDDPGKLADLRKRFGRIAEEAIKKDAPDELARPLELIGKLLSWLKTPPPYDDAFKLTVAEIAETYAASLQSNLMNKGEMI